MAGKREEKKQAVRQAIYDAATRLFETEGYDAVSVGRITSEVGIAKGTFFNHFPTKADILADWYTAVAETALARPDPNLSLADRLVALNQDTGAHLKSHPELWRAKTVEAPRSASLQAAERRVDQAFVDAVMTELNQSSLSKNPADLPAIADLVLAISTGTWREMLVTDRLDEAETMLRARITTLLTAFGACQN